MRKIYVCGTDTGVGKSIVSALLCKKLNADYWKPVQSGDLESRDSYTVKSLLGESYTGNFHPERYALKTPASAHIAAEIDGVSVHIRDFEVPQTDNTLVIESAGGCLHPMNLEETFVDLAPHFGSPILLVCKFYLGAFNHTLMSIESIQRRDIPLLGFVLNGEDHPGFRTFIEKKTGARCLGQVPNFEKLNAESIDTFTKTWEFSL